MDNRRQVMQQRKKSFQLFTYDNEVKCEIEANPIIVFISAQDQHNQKVLDQKYIKPFLMNIFSRGRNPCMPSNVQDWQITTRSHAGNNSQGKKLFEQASMKNEMLKYSDRLRYSGVKNAKIMK